MLCREDLEWWWLNSDIDENTESLKHVANTLEGNNSGEHKFIIIDFYTESGLANLTLFCWYFVITMQFNCNSIDTSLTSDYVRYNYIIPSSSNEITLIAWRKVSDNNYRVKIGTSGIVSAYQLMLVSGYNSKFVNTYTQPTWFSIQMYDSTISTIQISSDIKLGLSLCRCYILIWNTISALQAAYCCNYFSSTAAVFQRATYNGLSIKQRNIFCWIKFKHPQRICWNFYYWQIK